MLIFFYRMERVYGNVYHQQRKVSRTDERQHGSLHHDKTRGVISYQWDYMITGLYQIPSPSYRRIQPRRPLHRAVLPPKPSG